MIKQIWDKVKINSFIIRCIERCTAICPAIDKVGRDKYINAFFIYFKKTFKLYIYIYSSFILARHNKSQKFGPEFRF